MTHRDIYSAYASKSQDNKMLFYVEFYFFETVALPQENLENYGFYV